MPCRGFEISFVFGINNLAILWAEKWIHGPYTVRGGCGQSGKGAGNLTSNLPNPACSTVGTSPPVEGADKLKASVIQRYSLICLLLTAMPAVAATSFETTVAPVLEKRCVVCHGPTAQNAKVRLDNLSADLLNDRRAAETWHDVLNALNKGKMPPKGAPQLTTEERSAVVDWLTAEISNVAKQRRGTGGEVVLRRLNRVEYQNTMSDLLGLDLDYIKNLPPDQQSRDGFKNNGSDLRMSPLQLEYYLEAARRGLRSAIVEGPPPKVIAHRATETVEDKVPREHWSNRLGRTGTFVARSDAFPDSGDFIIRVRARAEFPAADSPYPRMQVTLGYRADTQTPSREVGHVDVTSESTHEFEFRGRIEEFPRQSRTQSKYPGLLIWIRNAYSDGHPAPEPVEHVTEVNGKKSRSYTWNEDSRFPKIVIESVEFRAPVYLRWPPEHHRSLIPETPGSAAAELAAAESALRPFMRRAFRHPVGDEAVANTLSFFTKVRPTVESFEQAMRETMAMVLVSPNFLYQVETTNGAGVGLDDYEFAARLSYFLWGTMPDEKLSRLAEQGMLDDPAVVTTEVDRMLDDRRSWSFVEQFSDAWLDLPGVDRIAINPNYYPDFDAALKADMRRETQHFFAEILRKDLNALSFLRADFSMLNQPLAAHYGVAGPRGGAFERVSLADSKRPGGLLSQASVLLSNSTGEDSHPVERGVWIRRALFNDPPAPPPPSVPNLDSAEDFALLPLKQQLEQHRDNAACAHCHQGIDPWGIALEEYDAVGLKRDTILRRSGEREARHPVDAAATLPDGHAVDGLESLIDYMLHQKDREFARALTSKLLTYSLGRSLEFNDDKTVDELTEKFIAGGYSLRDLITMIVTSESFRGISEKRG